MSGFIRSPVCAYCACYLERGRRERAHPHAMDMWFDEDIQPSHHYYPFYYYHRHFPLRNGLKRRVRQLEDEAPFGIPAPSVFVHRRTKEVNRTPSVRPSDGELLQSLARRLEALEEFIAGPKKQPTQSHSNPNAPRFRQQAPQNPVKKTRFHAQKRPSLRLAPDHAATIIQSRFRAYLVRRSQTLAHLRDLGVVKSTLKELNVLFADIGYRRVLCRDPDERRRFSERALSLLLKVDSIPGSNCMVREARRSISKEIVGLLDAVDRLESRSTNGRRVRSKRPPKNQVEDSDASQVRTGDEGRDIEGVRTAGAHVPIAHFWGSRGTCEQEAAAAEGLDDRGGLGFGICCSSGHERKRYDSKPPPAFTFRGRGHGALPPHLQREIVEVLAMSGFGFHFPPWI